ncbi:MAG: FadR family transcriptional regulator [Burkholderiales bacterium]|nr:FadR family transcriptional regulator [Burkholderiales bacterium]
MDALLSLREALLDQLRSREFRPGQRMPTERALSQQYGLSRSGVRRVLLDLKKRRLITQTVGSGTYVADDVGRALADMASAAPSMSTSPSELMNARMVLEPALIDLVIGHATAADFQRLDECCDMAESAPSQQEFERWDGLLHEAIAEATHNSFITSVFRLMTQVRAHSEWGLLKRRSATPERRHAYQLEHRALVAALKERDAARARDLCLAHLAHVRRDLLGF